MSSNHLASVPCGKQKNRNWHNVFKGHHLILGNVGKEMQETN